MSAAISFWCCSISSRKRARMRARRNGVVARHAGKAATAAFSASSTSLASANGTVRTTSPVAALVTAPERVLCEGVFFPLIQSGTVTADVDTGAATAGVDMASSLEQEGEFILLQPTRQRKQVYFRPMISRRVVCALAAVAALAAAGLRVSAQASAPRSAQGADEAFGKFWAASRPSEAAKIVDELLATHIGFADALRRLKQGRTYSAQKTGVVQMSNQPRDGIRHYFALNVPSGYDPARKYQVRFHLHGGVEGRPDNQPRGPGEIGPLAGVEQIYIIPYAWRDAPWWSEDQILNLRAILDIAKRL